MLIGLVLITEQDVGRVIKPIVLELNFVDWWSYVLGGVISIVSCSCLVQYTFSRFFVCFVELEVKVELDAFLFVFVAFEIFLDLNGAPAFVDL